MKKDLLRTALKAALLTFCIVFFILLLVCSYFDITVLVPLALSLLAAMPIGVLTWYHKRIDLLERQISWLIERLDKLEPKG